jgi:hypothetical protein
MNYCRLASVQATGNTLATCIIFELHVAVNNVQMFTVAMGTKDWFILPPLSSYKIFHTVFNNVSNLGLYIRCPTSLSDLKQIWNFSKGCLKIPLYQISRKAVQWEPRWFIRTDGRTDGWTGIPKLTGIFRDLSERVWRGKVHHLKTEICWNIS